MIESSPSSVEQPAITQSKPRFSVLNGIFAKRWGFLRNVAVLSGGTALAQVLNVALSPIISRLYTPANMGELALFTTFLSFFLVGTSLKYELGIVSAETEREATQLSFLSILFCLPMSLVAGALVWFLMDYALLGFGGLPSITPLLIIPATAAGGAFVALRYWFIRHEKFGFISHNIVMQHGARSLSQAGLGVLGPSSVSLFVGEMIGRFVGMGRMLRGYWPWLRPYLRDTSLAEYRGILGKHRKLLVYSLGSSYLDTLAASLALPLLIQAFGSSSGGQFALVQRVLALPLSLIASSVADAFHSRLALHARNASSSMIGFFHRTTLFLLLAGAVPSLVLIAAGPRLFALIFGRPWTLAGSLAALCIPWFLTQFIVSPLSRVVFVLRGQESKLVYDIFVVLSVIGVFVIGRHYGMSFYHMVLALSIVNAVGYVIYYLVLLRIVVVYSRTHCS